MSEKAAGIDRKAVTVSIESDRLSMCGRISRSVFNGEILKRYIMCIYKQCICAEGTTLTSIGHQIQGIIIIGDDSIGIVFTHTTQCNIGFIYSQFFMINARFDFNDSWCLISGRNMCYCSTDSGKMIRIAGNMEYFLHGKILSLFLNIF